MKKFFTSLIAFAVLLCAIVLASACAPTSSSEISARAASRQTVIPVYATLESVPTVRESSREAVAIKNETLLVAATGRRSNFKRLKTETPKRVNPEILQTFYEEPPDISGYNGIGFANQVRAQPQIERS